MHTSYRVFVCVCYGLSLGCWQTYGVRCARGSPNHPRRPPCTVGRYGSVYCCSRSNAAHRIRIAWHGWRVAGASLRRGRCSPQSRAESHGWADHAARMPENKSEAATHRNASAMIDSYSSFVMPCAILNSAFSRASFTRDATSTSASFFAANERISCHDNAQHEPLVHDMHDGKWRMTDDIACGVRHDSSRLRSAAYAASGWLPRAAHGRRCGRRRRRLA